MSDAPDSPVPASPGAALRSRWQERADGRESMILPSDLAHPPLRVTVDSLVRHFERGGPPFPLRNPHHENRVSQEHRAEATPAAVLILIVDRSEGLTVVLTERHASISYAGHFVFPGGRRDEVDDDAGANALRETEEEIGITPDQVQLLGRLGDYVTHSGFRIAPYVGLIREPVRFRPNPGEVEAIVEIPLEHVLRSDSYELRGWKDSKHAHYLLHHGEAFVAGPTVSMMIGLYESLLESHASV